MSILAAAADSVSDTSAPALAPWIAVVLMAFGGAGATGLFRARSVSGPSRLALGTQMIWRLLFAAAIGAFVWILPQQLYFVIHHPPGAATRPAAEFKEADLTPDDWVFLSTIPPVLGFLSVLGADFLLLGGPVEMERLGFHRDPLPGAARGLLGIVIVSPVIWFVSLLTEWFYDAHHIAHPMEHELLKMMGDASSPAVRTALIIAAVILAPLFEETIFRAHIQTFLREWLCQLSGAGPATSPPLPATSAAALPFAEGAPAPNETPPRKRSVAWQTWIAIVVTSALFAMVHPRWMWPPIFVLAVALGYAYERTGSLWTNIVMHALFNATSTYLFLNQ